VTFQVRTLKRATNDLLEIRDYIRRDAPETADRVIEELLDAISSLGRFPVRGARPRDERLRKLRFRFLVRDPYLVFYKIDSPRRLARVYRVLHARRAYAGIL
jgi:plasmid stabilization system protein ParE